MSNSWAFLSPIFSITLPWWISSTSIVTFSYGSLVTLSIFFVITSGEDTPNSNPSLLIFSIKIDKCSSPLPDTLNLSGWSVSSTRRATFVFNSWCNRSLIDLLVTSLPSCPANGLSLTCMIILRVGSSTESFSKTSNWPNSHIVSDIFNSPKPLTATMSPAVASSTSFFSRPWKFIICKTFPVRTSPFTLPIETCCPFFNCPLLILPVPIIPT